MRIHTMHRVFCLFLFLFCVPAWSAAMQGKIFNIRTIEEVYQNENDNTQVIFMVYREGKKGHVTRLSCFFPPKFRPKKMKHVKVGDLYERSLLEDDNYDRYLLVNYYCGRANGRNNGNSRTNGRKKGNGNPKRIAKPKNNKPKENAIQENVLQ